MGILDLITDYKSNMDEYVDTIWEYRDKRLDGWFLMSSPLPTLAICGLYIYLVKIWGPNFMKNREPFDLKNFMLVYNIFQVRCLQLRI